MRECIQILIKKYKEYSEYDKVGMSSFYVRLGFTHTMNLLPKTNHERYQYDYSRFVNEYTHADAETVKRMFEEAYNMPDSLAQQKYDMYMKVFKADNFNYHGYLSAVYNNLGVLFYNTGDRYKALDYLNLALQVTPNNETASKTKAAISQQLYQERSSNWTTTGSDGPNGWEIAGSILSGLGQLFGSNTASSGIYSGSHGNSGTTSSSSTDRSGATGTTPKVNHLNWKRLENAYSGYENQLIKMRSSGDINWSEVRSIQSKMKDIREKIYQQSGHKRAVSQWENWVP